MREQISNTDYRYPPKATTKLQEAAMISRFTHCLPYYVLLVSTLVGLGEGWTAPRILQRRLLPLSSKYQDNRRRSVPCRQSDKTDDTFSDVLLMERPATMTPEQDDDETLSVVLESFPTVTSMVEVETVVEDTDKYNREKLIVFGLLWAIACLSALDRVAMAVALVPMTEEFGLTDSVKGSISSLFSVGYGLCIIPSGLLVANASPKLVMAGGIAIWSLATIATPGATALDTMAPLLFVRACVGAAESVVMPTLQRLLSAWTKPDEKSLAFGTIFTGLQSGTILAYVLSPMIMDHFGSWREMFLVYGSFGAMLLVPWFVLAKDAPKSVFREKEENMSQEMLATTPSPVSGWERSLQQLQEAPWKDFAKSKGTWAMLLAHCSKNWGLYNTLAWTPTFYYEQYGIGVRDSVWLSVLPSVSGALGGILAGNLADGVIRNMKERTDESITRVRKVFQSISLLGPALALGTLASNIPDSAETAQFFLMASVGFQAFVVAGFEAGNQEKAGEKWAGLLYSVTSLPAVIFGTFGVWCVGQVLDVTNQDWSIVFFINAGVNILGAAAFLILYDSKKEFE